MNIPFIVLSIFFLFSSFAFNCTENWAIATCEVILFLGAGISGLLNKDFFKFPRKLALIALFVSFLVLICIVQLIPIPVSVWKVFDNSRIQMYEDGAKAEELLQSKEYRVDPFEKSEAPYESIRYTPKLPSFLTITRTPIPTLRALIAMLSFFCFLLLLEDVMNKGNRQLRKLGLLVGLIGLSVGLIALVEKGIEHRTHILWLRESTRAQTAFGPFVNNNHGEAFINLTFPILCYLIWRNIKKVKKISDKIGMSFTIIGLLTLQLALVVSGSSRGNILYLLLLPAFFLIQIGLKKRKLRAMLVSFLYLCLIAFGLIFAMKSGVLQNDARIRMNPNVFTEFTLVGNGIGSFEDVFPAEIRDWPIYREMRNAFLENEYLQIYLEAGVIGVLASVIFIGAILVQNFVLLKSYDRGFWLSCAVISELIRVWFDMTFHIIPLVATFLLLYALIRGRLKFE